MTHHDSTQSVNIANPGSLRITPVLKTVFGVFTVIGLVAIAAGIITQPARAWPNFLVNYFFYLMLALAGGFFTAIQHITNAYWSVTVRRVSEGLMSFLPVAFVLGLALLFFGQHHLYEWSHAEVVQHDHLLTLKKSYLNTGFFAARMIVFFVLWLVLGFGMRRQSLEQDKTGDHKHTLTNIRLSAIFLPVFAISVTLTSFDLLMSLEPHWFSTIYGVYCFSGLFFSGLSLMAVIVIYGRRQGVFNNQTVNANHLHDIGKLMFGFTVFWAYIMFSQLMLQWYANLPEETSYYLRRFHGGWWTYFWVLFAAHFVIPFFGLLPREAKRSDSYMFKMALFMLFAQWLDVYFLVMPVFFKEGPVFGWIEIGTALGFLGMFGISVGRFFEKVPALPVRDPRLADALAHSQ